jgi:diaminohydroxyphosphoribosylaminopyrimidine deaminase/5-amino-6-(5-phosphoribosylamino)uracil reductase
VDGVMVGVNTVIRDDPSLLSNASARKQPVRIIVDSALRSPRDAKIFSTVSTSPIVIAATRSASSDKIRMFESIGAKVLLTKSKSGRVDLNDLMRSLGRMKIMHLLVEGGGELVASLSEAKLIDRFLFFIAPKIIGGVDAVTSVEGKGAKTIAEALALKNIKIKLFDKDLLIESEAG